MSEMEKMKRYIERTKMNVSKGYSMNMLEGLELSKLAYEASDLPLEIIVFAFKYGKAKGYRAAKAEGRR
jgi:hypothetical protein